MNPFIYAFKHEAVKEKLGRLMICRKPVEVTGVESAPRNNNNRNIAAGTWQTSTGTAHQWSEESELEDFSVTQTLHRILALHKLHKPYVELSDVAK